jgi:hypothetical protein
MQAPHVFLLILPFICYTLPSSIHTQGNDDIGRPLLERALGIQERALGPDHPDVQAIKDVLNS